MVATSFSPVIIDFYRELHCVVIHSTQTSSKGAVTKLIAANCYGVNFRGLTQKFEVHIVMGERMLRIQHP